MTLKLTILSLGLIGLSLPAAAQNMNICGKGVIGDLIAKNYAYNGNCSSVPKSWLSSLDSLSLKGPELTSINENSFKGLGLNSLTRLTIYDTNVREIPAGAFKELTKLQTLNLSTSKISKISDRAFDGIRVTSLSLSFNEITTYPARALESQKGSLTQLEIQGNGITSIPSNAFLGFSYLQKLDLSMNQIATFSASAFNGLSSPKTLNITTNPVISLHPDMFAGVYIESVKLPLGSIRILGPNFLRSKTIKHLQILTAEGVEIEAKAFSGLENLESLDLSGSKLLQLPKEALEDLKKLQSLDLSSNLLSSVPSFPALPLLTKLHLKGNPIVHIAANSFSGLNKLSELDLSKTQLRVIEKDAFSGLSSLEKLNLEHNELTVIESGVFNALPKLMYLLLGYNQIEALDEKSLSGMTSLRYLSIKGNVVTEVSRSYVGLDIYTYTIHGAKDVDLFNATHFDIYLSYFQWDFVGRKYLKEPVHAKIKFSKELYQKLKPRSLELNCRLQNMPKMFFTVKGPQANLSFEDERNTEETKDFTNFGPDLSLAIHKERKEDNKHYKDTFYAQSFKEFTSQHGNFSANTVVSDLAIYNPDVHGNQNNVPVTNGFYCYVLKFNADGTYSTVAP